MYPQRRFRAAVAWRLCGGRYIDCPQTAQGCYGRCRTSMNHEGSSLDQARHRTKRAWTVRSKASLRPHHSLRKANARCQSFARRSRQGGVYERVRLMHWGAAWGGHFRDVCTAALYPSGGVAGVAGVAESGSGGSDSMADGGGLAAEVAPALAFSASLASMRALARSRRLSATIGSVVVTAAGVGSGVCSRSGSEGGRIGAGVPGGSVAPRATAHPAGGKQPQRDARVKQVSPSARSGGRTRGGKSAAKANSDDESPAKPPSRGW